MYTYTATNEYDDDEERSGYTGGGGQGYDNLLPPNTAVNAVYYG